MDSKEWLLQAFDYDAWANKQWAEALGGFTDAKRGLDVFQHMLLAQQIWLERCGGRTVPRSSDQALGNEVDAITAAWKARLEDADLDEIIEYKNLRGEPFENTLHEIVGHVINHGTYHRGQLREIAEVQSAPFPETDLILFLREY